MSTSRDSSNGESYKLVSEALKDIDSYKRSKELEHLKGAEAKLGQARSEDPGNLSALFYSAVVNDLIGKPKDAAEQFEQMLREDTPYATEIKYNLAVAYYHRYSHRWLKKADEHFNSVIRNTSNLVLQLLAHAGLAQTHAMWIIQPNPKEPDEEEARAHFDESKRHYDIVTDRVDFLETLDRDTFNEIKWTVLNARGMSLMYYTDYFEEVDRKLDMLEEALEHLMQADTYSPKNWANYCDIGSAHMRLMYWRIKNYHTPLLGSVRLLGADGNVYRFVAEDKSAVDQYVNEHVRPHLNESSRRLTEVVETLRPRYGFALYELGRLHRLAGDFDRAVQYFDEALAVDEDYRDVGDGTVNREKRRAEQEDCSFP